MTIACGRVGATTNDGVVADKGGEIGEANPPGGESPFDGPNIAIVLPF